MLPAARWMRRPPGHQFGTIITSGKPASPASRSRIPRHVSSKSQVLGFPRRRLPHPHEPAKAEAQPPISKIEAVSRALSTTPDSSNPLVQPVHIPEDPNGVLKETHPATRLLDNSSLVVQRQLEMMNVLVGFEQANRYIIMDPHGSHIGYLVEQEHGIGNAMTRQMFGTHRSFTTHVFDKEEKEVLRFHRPFSWINSRIRVYDAVGHDSDAYSNSTGLQGTSTGSIVNQTSASVSNLPLHDMRTIGATEQEWAPLRRKYNMFLARNLDDGDTRNAPQITSGHLSLSNSKAVLVAEEQPKEVGMLQFARVDEPFLSWDFSLKSEDGNLIGSVNRNFAGFAREIFTDTGVYALKMDAVASPSQEMGAGHKQAGMTLDQRAVILATAVSIDFDYFSRHSGSGGIWPTWIPWFGGGGEATGGAAASGAVGAAGKTGIASEVGAAARGVGSSESVIAGAGTMAGYEAMQGARGGQQQQKVDDMSPRASEPFQPSSDQDAWGGENHQDVWGEGKDPWGEGGGDGGGGGISWSDFSE